MKKSRKASTNEKRSTNPKRDSSSKKSTPTKNRPKKSKKSPTASPKSRSPKSSVNKSFSVSSKNKSPSTKSKPKTSKKESVLDTPNRPSLSTINPPPIEPSVVNGEENLERNIRSLQEANSSKLLLNPNMCSIHYQPFVLYCETCEEPVCEGCYHSGAHTGIRHKLIDLKEAFMTRIEFLNGHCEQLMSKREVIMVQIDKVEYRVNEINSVGEIIEKDIKTEYAGMLERHNYKEGESLAVLQHNMGNLEKDVERLDNILNTIDEYSQADTRSDSISFLRKYNELLEYSEYALAKPFKTNIDIDDLSTEYDEIMGSLESSEKLNILIQLKDDLIFDLLVKKYIESEYDIWEQLKKRYERQVNTYQMVCSYCGQELNGITVNAHCLKNETERRFQERFTIKDPPIELNGSGRHYFGRSVGNTNNLIPRIMIDRKASVAFNAICSGSRSIGLSVIKKIINYDTGSTNKIPLDKFIEAFANKYDMEQDYFNRLAAVLDPSSESAKTVAYKEFINYIEELMLNKPRIDKKSIRDSHSSKKVTNKSSKNSQTFNKEEVKEGRSAMKNEVIIENKATQNAILEDTKKKEVSYSQMPFSSSEPSKHYFKEYRIEPDIFNSLRKKGVNKKHILMQLEEYDTLRKGSVPIDVLYMAFSKPNTGITSAELERLVKKWFPQAIQSGNIEYDNFLDKLL